MKASKTQVHIFMGTGGVGKTTLSAAFGLHLAQKGRKVLIITIDPSQRLKTALNLRPHGQNQKAQDNPEVWASLLDSKWIFDDFVTRNLKDKEKIQRLFSNRLYQKLSTDLAGSQEFTSLEKLLFEWEQNIWDDIVLDTPPAAHTIEFLEAPDKLSRLLDEKVARWFRPKQDLSWSLEGLVGLGARRLLKVLEFLTGNEFIAELNDFFNQVYFWQEKLLSRLETSQKLLRHPQCHFYLVSGHYLPKILETLNVLKVMGEKGFQVEKLYLNRAYPWWWEELSKTSSAHTNPQVNTWKAGWNDFLNQRIQLFDKIVQKEGLKVAQVSHLPEIANHRYEGFEGLLRLASILTEDNPQ